MSVRSEPAPRLIVVERSDITGAVAGALIDALNAELSLMYPEPGATHFRLDADEVAPSRGAFVVAHRDGHPVGCGAVRHVPDAGRGLRTAELKRMYVVPELRGRGVGRALLEYLEHEARSLGFDRLVLETGSRQLAALAMYRRAGFVQIPAYGEYTASALSVCMARDLGSR